MYLVDDTVNPVRDIDVINLELILADLAQVGWWTGDHGNRR